MRFHKKTVAALALLGAGLFACSGEVSPFDEISSSSRECKYQIYRHDANSWLLTDPEVYMIFWGDWSSQDATSMQSNVMNDWYYLLNYDRVLARLSEYGIHEGNFQYVTYQTNSKPVVAFANDAGEDAGLLPELDDSKFAGELQAEIQLGLIPYPDDNTLYVVILPPGTTTVSMQNNNWNGYHQNSSYDGQRFAYAMIQYGSETSIDIVTSHEIYEACTNPQDGTGYWDDASNEEIADLCEGNDVNIDGYTVQAVWSQVLCTCQ